MYYVWYSFVSMDILVFIGEFPYKSSIFFLDLFYILWNLWNPYYCHFLVSSLWSVYKSDRSGFRSQREGSLSVFVFLKQLVLFASSIYIVHLFNWWLFEFAYGMYVLNFNHKLVLGDSHCQYIINPQYFSV